MEIDQTVFYQLNELGLGTSGAQLPLGGIGERLDPLRRADPVSLYAFPMKGYVIALVFGNW